MPTSESIMLSVNCIKINVAKKLLNCDKLVVLLRIYVRTVPLMDQSS